MPNFIDLTGQTFGRLTVIERDSSRNGTYFLCQCTCGNLKSIKSNDLKRGSTLSCSCLRSETSKNKSIDLTNHTYNRITVVSLDHRKKNKLYWLCRCECGNNLIIDSSHLRSSHTKSCGCYKLETTILRTEKHRMCKSPEYYSWGAIKNRCLNKKNPAYCNYGGRGITMFTDWIDSFESFFSYVGNRPSSKHSIDRIENNGNYEPGNVKWSTKKEQANNRRSSQFFIFMNESKTLSEWSETTGISYDVIRQRINKYGWSIEKALTTPLQGPPG
jgi:hypothetical protein